MMNSFVTSLIRSEFMKEAIFNLDLGKVGKMITVC